ncbi:MAG: DUF2330 domain-containing protein [Proteobacteria bacterium]|nr:DUF2330 domain-containing protein [Pseudomonadota bacterium]MCP4920825.1 DUF2330 domain-containing protein [Pseudomonadota bacterium]
MAHRTDGAPSWAFCGAYVGGAEVDVTNGATRMAMVRQGDRTVLTLLNDAQGPTDHFGLLIPVGADLDAEDVVQVDTSALEALDAYSAPRLVTYTCEQIIDEGIGSTGGGAVGCGGTPPPQDTAEDAPPSVSAGGVTMDSAAVDVARVFPVGDYTATVLRGTEAGGLEQWLVDRDFVIDEDTSDALEDYAGIWFLALTVSTEAPLDEARWLPAIQIAYDSEAFSLPIRLGAASSDGEQDLVLFTVVDFASGQTHISNHPEAHVQDECLADVAAQDFGEFYSDLVPTDTAEASYVVEFAWGAGKCDPCPAEVPSLTDSLVQAVGYDGLATDAFFTRLHLRYAPSAVSEDLALYHSGIVSSTQQRYIQREHELESRWPVCQEGWSEDPGSCGLDTGWDSDVPEPEPQPDPSESGSSCLLCGSMAQAFGVFLLAGVLRRKRRPA